MVRHGGSSSGTPPRYQGIQAQSQHLPPLLREVFTTFKIRVEGNLNKGGGVYTLFQGSYGFDVSVLVKEADITHKELVMNDIKFMQALKAKSCFLEEYEESYGRIRVLQGMFEYSCTEILTLFNGSHNLQSILVGFTMRDLLGGIWKAMGYLHEKTIIHRDIRTKNTFVRRENGKPLR